MLPWWKQRRAKLFLGAVILALLSLAIALGVSLSSSDTPRAHRSFSNVPTKMPTTASPQQSPSNSPSMSPVIPAPCISNVTLDHALFEEYSYYSDEPPIAVIKGDTVVVSDGGLLVGCPNSGVIY